MLVVIFKTLGGSDTLPKQGPSFVEPELMLFARGVAVHKACWRNSSRDHRETDFPNVSH